MLATRCITQAQGASFPLRVSDEHFVRRVNMVFAHLSKSYSEQRILLRLAHADYNPSKQFPGKGHRYQGFHHCAILLQSNMHLSKCLLPAIRKRKARVRIPENSPPSNVYAVVAVAA